MTGFLLDLNRCVGCGACVLACRIENQLPDHVSWRRILPFNGRRRKEGPSFHLSLACHHCETPPCATACPSGALEKGADGVVHLHAARCLGCRYCEMACPFGAPSFDHDEGVMTKCHLCAPRTQEGREPACVQSCPTRALRAASASPASPDFLSAGEIPGFVDPGQARPNLRMATPVGGIRGESYEALKKLVRGGGSHG